jgi:hypothetical protein
MKTKFCDQALAVDYKQIWLDGNSKITMGNGTFDNPKPNSFSLPSISTCPGATKACLESCYVHGLEEAAPETHRRYRINEMVLHHVMEQILGKSSMRLFAKTLGQWIEKNCQGGFRWHVSGDVFNHRYADLIRLVCHHSAGVEHVIYTRSFFAVPILHNTDNLVVNVSLDRDNLIEGMMVADEFRCRPVVMVGEKDSNWFPHLPEHAVILPNYELRGRDLEKPTSHPWWQSLTRQQRKQVCPADFFGQSEHVRCGPCKKCLRKM